MKFIFNSLQISFNLPAVSIAICCDSITHGPAIRNNGWFRPTSKLQSFMPPPHYHYVKRHAWRFRWLAALPAPPLRAPCSCRHLFLLELNSLALQRGFNKSLEQGMSGARRGGEFGMELHTDEPRVRGLRQFHYLRQVFTGRARRYDQPGLFQRRHVMVVDFIAMTVTLIDFLSLIH